MSKITLVVGSALCAWEDLREATNMAEPDEIVCINTAGRDIGMPFDHWCSLHPALFDLWKAAREKNSLPLPKEYWTGSTSPTLGFCKQGRVDKGSSGRLGVDVALLNGATHIILCGVTLSPEYKHYDKDRPWEDAKQYRHIWMEELTPVKQQIRSFNGWTKDFFGVPTRKWLATKAKIAAASS